MRQRIKQQPVASVRGELVFKQSKKDRLYEMNRYADKKIEAIKVIQSTMTTEEVSLQKFETSLQRQIAEFRKQQKQLS